MFFDDQKIVAMREMILADSVEGREKALAKLLPYQKADFYGNPQGNGWLPREHPLARPTSPRVRTSRFGWSADHG